MSRELQSDAVSSVDRSSSGIADEQPAPQLQRESMSTESMATTSSAVPTAAGGDEPTAATSTEHSSPVPENDSTSTVAPDTSEANHNATDEVLTPCDDASDSVQRSPRDAAQRVALVDIASCDEIDTLTVRQLKSLLVNNYVDYKGCCEKQELVQRVRDLWNDHKRLNQTADADGSAMKDDDLCKVCMDAAVDCILLECGHMVVCTNCGKRLAECPICRRYVSRVVHVFRA